MSNPKDVAWLLHIKNKIQEKTIKIQKLNEQLKILHTEIDTLNDIIRPTDILSIEDALPLANTAFLGYGSPLGDTSPLGDISPPDVLVKLIEEISIDSITDKSDIIKKNWGSYSTTVVLLQIIHPLKSFINMMTMNLNIVQMKLNRLNMLNRLKKLNMLKKLNRLNRLILSQVKINSK